MTIKHSDITVIIQGNADNHTLRFTHWLCTTYPEIYVVVSCWENNSIDQELINYEHVTVIKSADPGTISVPKFKTDNIKRQIISTRRGLEKVKTKWAIKIRSDMTFNPNKLIYFLNQLKPMTNSPFRIYNNQVGVTQLTTLAPQKSGLYFHICDWVYFGLSDDIREIFKAPLPEDSFFRFFEKCEGEQEICSQYRSETHLVLHSIQSRFKIIYPFSGFKDYNLEKLSEKIMSANFCVFNSWNLGIKSNKHRSLWKWHQRNRYTYANAVQHGQRFHFLILLEDLAVKFLAEGVQVAIRIKRLAKKK